MKTNYVIFNHIQFITAGIMVVVLLISQFIQYQWWISNLGISDISFLKFIELLFKEGLTLEGMDIGTIGLTLSWIFQIVVPYFLATSIVGNILGQYIVKRVPEKVVEYVRYLIGLGKSQSEIRALLSQKGWNNMSDQDDIFSAIFQLIGFQKMNRE